MTSAGYYKGLSHVIAFVKLADPLGGFVAIEDRHAQVHQYEAVDVLAFGIRVTDDLEGFLAIVGTIHQLVQVVVPSLPYHELQAQNVVGFVIDNQDSLHGCGGAMLFLFVN